MSKFPILQRALAALALLGIVVSACLSWARQYQLLGGVTDEEVKRPMPENELDPNPTFLATRAITINGMPEQTWPWSMQMGYGKHPGGFTRALHPANERQTRLVRRIG